MREIKFRVWNKDYKVMGSGPVIKDGKCLKIVGIEIWGTSDDYILMQYTGLKDANGKEIYEGDIVEYLYWGTKTFKEVKWQDDTSGFYPFADSPENCGCCGMGKNPKNVEVIGNIYENSNLIERNENGI